MALNRWAGIGNLGRDPEVREFDNGGKVANVSIAVTEKWRDKASGEQRENTEWINLVMNDRQAEIAGQYLRKGSQIYAEGSLRTRKYQDRETGQDRYITEVRVQNFQMLGGRQDGGGEQRQSQAPRQSQPPRQNGGGQPPRQSQQAPRQQQYQQPQGGDGFDYDDGSDIPF